MNKLDIADILADFLPSNKEDMIQIDGRLSDLAHYVTDGGEVPPHAFTKLDNSQRAALLKFAVGGMFGFIRYNEEEGIEPIELDTH